MPSAEMKNPDPWASAPPVSRHSIRTTAGDALANNCAGDNATGVSTLMGAGGGTGSAGIGAGREAGAEVGRAWGVARAVSFVSLATGPGDAPRVLCGLSVGISRNQVTSNIATAA